MGKYICDDCAADLIQERKIRPLPESVYSANVKTSSALKLTREGICDCCWEEKNTTKNFDYSESMRKFTGIRVYDMEPFGDDIRIVSIPTDKVDENRSNPNREGERDDRWVRYDDVKHLIRGNE